MVREDQRPHPRASYGRGVGFEDAADDCPIRRHVKIVRIPLPGGARGRGAFEDETHLSTGGLGPLPDQQAAALFLVQVKLLDRHRFGPLAGVLRPIRGIRLCCG